MLENSNALCSASEANKQNLPDRALDLPVSFRYNKITSPSLTQTRASLTGFRASFCGSVYFELPVARISFFCNRCFELNAAVPIALQNLTSSFLPVKFKFQD